MNTNDTFHGGLLIVSVLGLFAIATVGATPARAAERQDAQTQSIHVSFNREQLSNPKVAEHLYRDLQQASRKVCSASYSRNDSLENYAKWQACYRQTLRDAIAQVDSPVMLAMFNGTKGVQG